MIYITVDTHNDFTRFFDRRLLKKGIQLNEKDYDLQRVSVTGKSRYKHGDIVKLVFDDSEKTGEICVVDACGTFEQNEEPSYDISIEGENTYISIYVHQIY